MGRDEIHVSLPPRLLEDIEIGGVELGELREIAGVPEVVDLIAKRLGDGEACWVKNPLTKTVQRRQLWAQLATAVRCYRTRNPLGCRPEGFFFARAVSCA